MSLAVKIIVFLATGGIVGAISFFLFAFMLIAMNGYSESDANYGIVLFIFWSVAGCVLAAALAVMAAHLIEKRRGLHFAVSGLISTAVFVILGVIINSIGVGAGILLSEIVRTSF